MADEPGTVGGGAVSAPGDAVDLPEPDPSLLPPPGGGARDVERLYFDPEKWDAEVVNSLDVGDLDPVGTGRGRVEGRGAAALFVSDLHMADGSAGGDDFLESHLRAEEEFGGLYAGFFPPGESRAGLFVSALTFALRRVADRVGADASLDVVLNGDVINFLELKGRGGTYVSRRHAPFFRALAGLRGRASVYWLRGNHDYVVPSGPWRGGEFYVNPGLRVLAEHGDFWDDENWPPGPANKGSRMVIELGGAFEVHASVSKEGTIQYLLAGVDNLRPWDNEAIEGFLDRRGKYSDVAALSSALARLEYVGAADDSEAYEGARRRRTGEHRDWLMVQGHTHVPAMAPGVYYNLGTWITSLVAPGGEEKQVEAFPFLLVYVDARGKRVEEYYVVRRKAPAEAAKAVLQSTEMVNELRKEFGYKNSIP
jgi:UDP-2,3-diacylglucosamine pyrophosphatase LpxH